MSLRPPSNAEREVLAKLLSQKFPGRDALLAQIDGITVEEIDAEGSLRLVPGSGASVAAVQDRVPVEAELPVDGEMAIRVLLHVVDGFLYELEIYQDDLESIESQLSPEKLRLIFPRDRTEAPISQAKVALGQGGSGEYRPLPEGELLRLNDWEVHGALLAAAFFFMCGLAFFIPDEIDAVAGLIAIGIGLGFAEVGRSGVVVEKAGITVRGMFRGRQWNWSEVDHFEVRTPLIRGALRVYLRNGKVVSAPGLNGFSRRERRLSEAWIAELNRRAGGSAN